MNDLLDVHAALSPLSIYRMSTPVEGFDGGVSIDTPTTSLLGVLATIPTFRDAQVGDVLQVFMEGEPTPIAPPFQIADRDLNRPLSLYLAADRFTPGEKRLYYTFTRQGLERERSRSLSVYVKLTRPDGVDIDPAPGHEGQVAAEVDTGNVQLPVARVQGVDSDGYIDLQAFQGDATLSLEPWQIAQGQVIWITLRGTQGQGAGWELPLVVAHVVSQDQTVNGFRWPIPRAALEILADGTRLSIHTAVNTAGEDDFEGAIQAPVMAYEIRAGRAIALFVSTGGLKSNALPNDWAHPKETNGVTVVGEAGEVVWVTAGVDDASFPGGEHQAQVTLNEHGDAHLMVRCSSASTTVTASSASSFPAEAELHFANTFPPDRVSGSQSVRASLATGAKANGRSPNRVCFDTTGITSNYPILVWVSLTGSAKFVGVSGQRVGFPLKRGTWDCYFDVVDTRAETVTLSFELATNTSYPWARFSKTMTFT